jgi:hypothetical protein
VPLTRARRRPSENLNPKAQSTVVVNGRVGMARLGVLLEYPEVVHTISGRPCAAIGARTPGFHPVCDGARQLRHSAAVWKPNQFVRCPLLDDCAFERPVTETTADIVGARRAEVSPTNRATVLARHAARSRFTMSRTVFLLSPSRWLISRYDCPWPTSFSTLGAKRSALTR